MPNDSGKWFPLHSALIFGDVAAAKYLFDRGGKDAGMLAKANGKGWRALHFACHSGDYDSVAWLLGLEVCDPTLRTKLGETALHLSALRGDERMCQMLIDGGCPPEAVTREGKTALHLAAGIGHLNVARFLVVGAGLSPSTPDGGGASAAALALAGNHKAVVRLLQKNCPGVPMGIPKGSGGTRRPSFDSVGGVEYMTKGKRGHRQRRSKESGVVFGGDGDGRVKGGGGRKRGDLKGTDEAGSRLLEAARVGDTMAMGRVLARGEIDVEWVGSSNGWTAIMEAAEHGSLEGVCYLLDMGADLEHTNKKGLTPLQLAVRSGHLGVTEELLSRGARPNVITKAGLCLRCLASSAGHGYLADWLFTMGVADGEDGGCACSGIAMKNGGISGGGVEGAAAVLNGLAPRTRQHSSGAVRNGVPPEPALVSEAAAALTEWLAGIGLGAYENQLVSHGFDTLDAMSTATEEDLEAMGFKKGHLRLLLARVPSALVASGNGGGSQGSVDARANPARSTDELKHEKLGEVANMEEEEEEEEEEEDREDREEGEGSYWGAKALQPSRALSLGGDSANSGGGGGDGFKQLKPEEVEMDDVVGEGSFGVVRRARWRGMEVAVKELKNYTSTAVAAGAGAGPAGVGMGATHGAGMSGAAGRCGGGAVVEDLTDSEEDMRHEASMLAKVCNHNCVVQFVGVLLRPVPSVVTMFMQNGSVEDMLVSTDTPATKDLVARMAIEAAKGVIHLHREGVVHRDLASRNLLLDDGFHVRISDFGFSRVKRECASRGYTRSDMGPIKWTSPEAMRKRCYSEASDAFSFGVVLYEMFARSPPWHGHENLDVAFRVCSGERMEVPPRVDPAIAELMNKCWDGNPRLRPDFASILTALTCFEGDQKNKAASAALVATAPSPPPPPPRSSKKSVEAMKNARARAEAAALAKAAVAELKRRRSSALLEATRLHRRNAEARSGGGDPGVGAYAGAYAGADAGAVADDGADAAAETETEVVVMTTAQSHLRRRVALDRDSTTSSIGRARESFTVSGQHEQQQQQQQQEHQKQQEGGAERHAPAGAAAATGGGSAGADASPTVDSDARDAGIARGNAAASATASSAVDATTPLETNVSGRKYNSFSKSSWLSRRGSGGRFVGRGGGGGGRERGRGWGAAGERERRGFQSHNGRNFEDGRKGRAPPASEEGLRSPQLVSDRGSEVGGRGVGRGGRVPHLGFGGSRPPLPRQLSGRGGGRGGGGGGGGRNGGK